MDNEIDFSKDCGNNYETDEYQGELILEAKGFIEAYKENLKSSLRDEKSVIYIDFMEMTEHSTILADESIKRPDETIQIIEMAIEEIGLAEKVRVRFFNIPKSHEIKISDIVPQYMDGLILTKGVIKKVGKKLTKDKISKFECPKCGTVEIINQDGIDFKIPGNCSCGLSRAFKEIKETPRRHNESIQRITIEEFPNNSNTKQFPKSIIIELRNDLIIPNLESYLGLDCEIIGAVKKIPKILPYKKVSTEGELIVRANNFILSETTFDELNISEEDEQQIQELAANPEVVSILKESIAPSICGYEEIKESLLLQLFGGVEKHKKDGLISRGNIHIMIIGDPGTAKSEFLKFINNISPRGKHLSQQKNTEVTIMPEIAKDEITGDVMLEAGEVALANRDILCIENLERMADKEISVIENIMEVQKIKIDKKGFNTELEVKTSVLSTASPKFGRFDSNQMIFSQINFSPKFINQFDLVFPLIDTPSICDDTKIANSILSEHQGDEKDIYINQELFTKYILYAKYKIIPKLTDKAVSKMREFYVGLRNRPVVEGQEMRSIPISARQLNSLVRMSEAAARIRLSGTVDEEDADVAIKLLNYYLKQTGYDEEIGQIDMSKITGTMKASERNQNYTVRNAIDALMKKHGEIIPYNLIIERLKNEMTKNEVEKSIRKLKEKGDLFEPKSKFYQRM